MDEIKTDATNESVENQEVVTEQTTETAETTGGKPKNKVKLPAWLQKLVDKIKSNEDVRQMVVFTLFSFICGGSQLIITLVLPALLKLGGGVLTQRF